MDIKHQKHLISDFIQTRTYYEERTLYLESPFDILDYLKQTIE